MPRRGTEVGQLLEPPKKKSKAILEETPSLDVSFFDDEALPPGIVFTDVQQKKWRLGKPIGRGSFGRIYLASDETEMEVTKQNARYVVKIEPHSNGPLFVEIHCLIRTAQASKVKAWRQKHKQKSLGMPVYIASGSFIDENTNTKYRFLVLPRYDIDLQKITSRTRVLDLKNVLVLAQQILDVLEYLHDQGYTHSDIKSSNLMIGFDGNKLNKVPILKPALSFQKDTKEATPVLTGKQRKVKTGKSRSSNYYEDEDFTIRDYKSPSPEDSDRRLVNVKNKLRKILSNKDKRTLHRHHAFNLRQLSNYVNYEDLNSSVCSDQSYQRLLDDFEATFKIPEDPTDYKSDNVNDDIFKEAILSQSNGQIYLLDYGLASKFLDSSGKHKEFGMDARKAHDGTMEYSSRDSHIGAHSRRSDLETLGYNLLDWLTGSLPWKTPEVLAEPDLVHALKKDFMSDIKSFLKTCFKTEFYPEFLEKYLEYVTSLDFTERPDYDYCRSLFKSELLRIGCADKNVFLNFMEPLKLPMSRKLCYSQRFGRKNTPSDFLARNGIKKSYERENFCSLENDLKLELLKKTLNSSSDGIRKPCTSRNFFISDADLVARLKKSLMPYDTFGKKLSPKNLRSKNVKPKKGGKRTHRNSIGKFGNFMGSARQFTWAEILAGNPEDIIRKERNVAPEENDDDEDTYKYRIRRLSTSSSEKSYDANNPSPLLQKDYLDELNPTYAMKEVVANFKRRLQGKPAKDETDSTHIEGYTPAMIKYYKIKTKREAKEKAESLKATDSDPPEYLPRNKRSKNKTVKTDVPVRVTRQKTNSTSSDDSKVKDTKKENKTCLKKSSTKKSCVKSYEEKKEVNFVEPVKITLNTNKKSTSKRQSTATVPPNRRRLRSSRRKA